MKQWINLLVAFVFLVTGMPALAQQNSVGRRVEGDTFPGLRYFRNHVKDGDFEKVTAVTGTPKGVAMTAVVNGSAVVTASLSDVVTGLGPVEGKSLALKGFTSTETVRITANPSRGYSLRGKTCEFSFDGGPSAYGVPLSIAVVETSPSAITLQSAVSMGFSIPVQRKVLNFPCPTDTDATIAIDITGTGSTQTGYVLDNMYIGEANNVGTAAQAYFVGSIRYPGKTNCVWQSTATTFTNLPADTDCDTPTVTGELTAPATKILGFGLPLAKVGTYQIVPIFAAAQADTGTHVVFRMSNGTVNSTVSMNESRDTNTTDFKTTSPMAMTFTSPVSNTTIQLQVSSNVSTTVSFGNAATTQSVSGFDVYYFPTASQDIISLSQTNWGPLPCTLTFTGITSNTNVSTFCEKDGKNLRVTGSLNVGTTSGTVLRIGFPYTMDTTAMAATTRNPLGRIWRGNGSSTAYASATTGPFPIIDVLGTSTTEVFYSVAPNGQSNFGTGSAANTAFANGDFMAFDFTVPISGWDSGTVVQNVTGLVSSDRHEVNLDTYAGYGSTNTKIYRLTNSTVNGTCLTYAASATLGDSVTVSTAYNCAGVYSMSSICDSDNSNDNWGFGISINSSQLTTDIHTINTGDRVAVYFANSKPTSEDQNVTVSNTRWLAGGTVIRMHGTGKVPATASKCRLDVVKVN